MSPSADSVPPVRVLVVILIAAGGVLLLLALWQAFASARSRYRTFDADLRKLDKIVDRNGSWDEMVAVRPTRLRAGTLGWAPDVAERTFYAELARPALLAALGIVAGTTGALLALWLPPG